MNDTIKSIRARYYSGDVGGAWLEAEQSYGKMTAQQFMIEFIWKKF